jgi:hypothetical protein
LLLIANIMLVGRLIGVGRVISAYCWCLVLVLVLFPWQAFLDNSGLTRTEAPFKLPGVLYTWDELVNPTHPAESGRFSGDFNTVALKWFRFAGAPIAAAILVLVIQVKSNRGMRQALGEDDAGFTQERTNA